MANVLKVAKVSSIKELHDQGWSQRRIAKELGVSRGAVARHLRKEGEVGSNRAKAPSGSAVGLDGQTRPKRPPGLGPHANPLRM